MDHQANIILDLLYDPTKDNNIHDKLSAKEKIELYGIEVKPLKYFFKGYYMKDTQLIGGNDKKVNSNDRIFPVYKKIEMKKWLCFYERNNYNDADNLYKTLSKASLAYELTIKEPEWVEMPNNSSSKDWINTVEDYIYKSNNQYSFIINSHLYKELKQYSL